MVVYFFLLTDHACTTSKFLYPSYVLEGNPSMIIIIIVNCHGNNKLGLLLVF